jgi:uncharacterized protein (TIGR02996 family)
MDDSAYLRAVCWSPFDDGPRLVYADRLEERGECARAEFIRVQCELATIDRKLGEHNSDSKGTCICRCCVILRKAIAPLRRRERELLEAFAPGRRKRNRWHWLQPLCEIMPPGWEATRDYDAVTFRRGFVSIITLTCRQFLGGPCEQCNGFEFIGLMSSPFERACSACRGTGHVEGLAAALFAAAPVTEVRLSDREPYQAEGAFWWSLAARPEMSSYLPNELLELLPGGKTGNFSSSNAAHAALSAACVAVGRARAKLPALARPVSADSPR